MMGSSMSRVGGKMTRKKKSSRFERLDQAIREDLNRFARVIALHPQPKTESSRE